MSALLHKVHDLSVLQIVLYGWVGLILLVVSLFIVAAVLMAAGNALGLVSLGPVKSKDLAFAKELVQQYEKYKREFSATRLPSSIGSDAILELVPSTEIEKGLDNLVRQTFGELPGKIFLTHSAFDEKKKIALTRHLCIFGDFSIMLKSTLDSTNLALFLNVSVWSGDGQDLITIIANQKLSLQVSKVLDEACPVFNARLFGFLAGAGRRFPETEKFESAASKIKAA